MLQSEDRPGISPDELLALVKRDDPGAHFAEHTVGGCRVLVTTKMRPDRICALAPDLQIHREIDFFAAEKGPSTLMDAWDELDLAAAAAIENVKVDGNVL